MPDERPGLCNFGPVSRPAAGVLLEVVQENLKMMVDGGTFIEDPHRFETLATWQVSIDEALAESDERIHDAEEALGERLEQERDDGG